MNSTIESTQIDDAWRQRREGPVLWKKTKAKLDRLDELEAELQHRQKAAAAKTEKMRTKRSRHLRACTLAVARRHRLQLAGWSGSVTSRNKWLRNQIALEIKSAKSNCVIPMLPKPPSLAFITQVLNTVTFFIRT